MSKDRLSRQINVREVIYSEYGMEVPERIEKYIDKNMYQRITNGKLVIEKKDLLKDDIDLSRLAKARMKELGISLPDMAYMLKVTTPAITGVLSGHNTGKLSQQKYILMLQILGIQIKMTFSLLDF